MLRITSRTRRRRGAAPAVDTKGDNDWYWATYNLHLTKS
jgi:hypothetical protein